MPFKLLSSSLVFCKSKSITCMDTSRFTCASLAAALICFSVSSMPSTVRASKRARTLCRTTEPPTLVLASFRTKAVATA
eukprot:scaffold2912_cov67-Attheya_sp.AAC.5